MRERLFTSNFKLIVTTVMFIFVILAGLIFAGEIYEKCASLNRINVWSKQRFDDFYALKENSIDMLFVGSSHSYCTFDPEKINAEMGISSYQLGLPNQLPSSTYYTVLEALRTQKPKTVVMEVYWHVLDVDFEPKQIDYLFKVMRSEDLKQDYYENGFPLPEKVKYNIKAIRYQQEFFAYANKRIVDFVNARGSVTAAARPNGTEYYRSLGYTFCDIIMSKADYEKEERSTGIDGEKWKMSKVQRNYVYDIAKICEENDIELVLVTAPISLVAFRNIENYDKIHGKVSAMAQDLGANYLDYNLIATELFTDEDFRDPRHLNDFGVAKADKYFAKWYNTKQ